MKTYKRLDLLLNEIQDRYVQENFLRIESFLDGLFNTLVEQTLDFTVESSVHMPKVANDEFQLDVFKLPTCDKEPTNPPRSREPGYAVWDIKDKKLCIWDGSVWRKI